MSAETIAISSHHGFTPRKKQHSRKRVFDLGGHSYMGVPGCSWSTNYWVKRITPNEWELYCAPEGRLSHREWAGNYTVEELREYFDSVEFWMDEEEWISMGLGTNTEVVSIGCTQTKPEEDRVDG